MTKRALKFALQPEVSMSTLVSQAQEEMNCNSSQDWDYGLGTEAGAVSVWSL